MKKTVTSLRLVFAALTAFLLASASPALAQAAINFTNYTTANGLGGNVANSVYSSGSTIYVATDGGLGISTNGGKNWTNTTFGSGVSIDTRGVYVPADATNWVYAATYGLSPNGGVSKSIDGGASFTSMTNVALINSIYAPSYWNVYTTTVGSGLGISTDGGLTWNYRTIANAGLPSNTTYGVYTVGSNVYVATDNGFGRSTNGGTSFTASNTDNGLGSNATRGVYASGNTIYVATQGA